MKIIETEELAKLIDDHAPLALLEALPRRYYEQGHLPGAQHFPHDEVRAVYAAGKAGWVGSGRALARTAA